MVSIPEVTGVFLSDFSEFSLQVMTLVQHTVSAATFEREEAEETMDLVLKCWVNLLSGMWTFGAVDSPLESDVLTKKMTEFVQELAGKIFVMYVDTRLKLCRVEMEDDEGDEGASIELSSCQTCHHR